MIQVKVERGPIPPPLRRTVKYPFPTMKVGEWFEVTTGGLLPMERSVRQAAYRAGKELERRFRCRRVAGGITVERVA